MHQQAIARLIMLRHMPLPEEEMKPLKITINGQKFTAELYDNEAAQKFMQLLPLSLTMKELNNNENIAILIRLCQQMHKSREKLMPGILCFSAMTAWLCFIKALIPVTVIPELAE